MQLSILCPTPDVQLDWREPFARLKAAFEAAGLRVSALPWTELGDPRVKAAAACLAWGYHSQPERWTTLVRASLGSVTLVNSARTLIWNSDKIYLEEIGRSVPIVPTHFASRLDEDMVSALRQRFQTDTLIAKPRWGAGAHGLTILRDGAPVPPLRNVLIQPMLTSIGEGEISLIYFGGRFSHAMRKIPAAGELRVQSEHGGRVERYEASGALVELGKRAIQAAPEALAYARVDVVKGNDGVWQVMELEAIEPELFLSWAPDGGRALAEAICERLSSPEVQQSASGGPLSKE
jgi:glutathione synthase/RimK-type ligase-like ATP-grasp enzyme